MFPNKQTHLPTYKRNYYIKYQRFLHLKSSRHGSSMLTADGQRTHRITPCSTAVTVPLCPFIVRSGPQSKTPFQFSFELLALLKPIFGCRFCKVKAMLSVITTKMWFLLLFRNHLQPIPCTAVCAMYYNVLQYSTLLYTQANVRNHKVHVG